MLRKRVLSLMLFVLLAAWMGACSAPAPEATSAPGPAQPTLAPGEVIHLIGEGGGKSNPLTSDSFDLEGAGTIAVYFRQDCDYFYLQMWNSNEALAQAPGGTVIFESAAAPSERLEGDPYLIPYEYVPGEYVFKIDAAAQDGACDWEVWARVEQLP